GFYIDPNLPLSPLSLRHKKRLSIPDSQSFVNLKSNTMKNTVQRYGLSAYLQILKPERDIL
ncbi:hypothetical protein, partial [Bacteroides faecis]|uniref:hypothetical protein n=1 Tax=Bacteroides faecis TaxID=674529 RepID=UPI00114608D4